MAQEMDNSLYENDPRGVGFITAKPGDVLGYRQNGRPIRLIAGSAKESDDDEDENENEEDDDDDDEDEEDEESGEDKLPTLDEWKRTRKALKKANAEAKRHRLKNRKLKQTASANPNDSNKNSDDKKKKVEKEEVDESFVEAKVEEKLQARYKPLIINNAAKALLKEQGLISKPDRLLKLIDHDSIDIDDNGNVDGLQEEVDGLKEDYPEFFEDEDDKKKKRTTGKVDAAGKSGKGNKGAQKSKRSADLIAKQLLK